jgi:putative oxidoreductase
MKDLKIQALKNKKMGRNQMTNKQQIGALILRVVLGITFFAHGLAKFETIQMISGWFQSIGIPSFMAYVVATIETVGGIALILGIGTRIVSALLVVILLVATLKVKLAVGFMGNGQMAGYELDLSMMVTALYLALNGSRMLSLDSVLGSKKG